MLGAGLGKEVIVQETKSFGSCYISTRGCPNHYRFIFIRTYVNIVLNCKYGVLR